jgi:hypothetical protein
MRLWVTAGGATEMTVKTACRLLHEVLDKASQAGISRVNLDAVVIPTGRVSTPGPNGADLWRSGKHKHHGGNIQITHLPAQCIPHQVDRCGRWSGLRVWISSASMRRRISRLLGRSDR